MEHATIIADYLIKFKEKLKDLYQWNPDLKSLKSKEILNDEELKELTDSKINDNQYDTEVKLKKIISKYLNEASRLNQVEKFNDLANWIIQDWGGIRTGGSALNEALLLSIKEKGSLPFDRIASYSKVAAFMHLEDFIIYDSRVAYSLNWILLSSNKVTKDFFPIPEGRNSKMIAYDMNVLIRLVLKDLYNPIDKEEINNRLFISDTDKKVFLAKNNSYSILNELVKKAHHIIWGEHDNELYKTEMLLFSIADKDIYLDIVSKVNFNINV